MGSAFRRAVKFALCAALLVLSVHAAKNKAISDEAAISLVKRTTASSLDPALPRRSFSAWINEKFRDWVVAWEVNDCGEAAGDPQSDNKRDMPACVQVDIMEPTHDLARATSRGFQVLFHVGTQNKGLLPVPRFRSAVRIEDSSTQTLNGLSDVEP